MYAARLRGLMFNDAFTHQDSKEIQEHAPQ